MSSDPDYMPNREPKVAQKPTNTAEHSTTGSQHPTHNGGDSSQ